MLEWSIVSAIIGFFIITIVDRIWFLIDYKKAEKGLEILEHYHYSFVCWIIALLTVSFVPVISWGLVGAGVAFFYHESKQKNFFSYNSKHFKPSLYIAIGLCIVGLLLYFLISAI